MPVPSIVMFTPRSYQTFQRDSDNIGKVRIAGQLSDFTGAQDVDIRWDGGNWEPLQAGVAFRFDAIVDKPSGQYSLDIRAGGYIVALVYVGVGDVYLIMGQSNAHGQGVNKQVYTHPTLKASLFGMSYAWSELKDWASLPVANALDNLLVNGSTSSAFGSVWPLLATLIMADQNVPVGFITCAKGGTTIQEWLPADDEGDTNTLFGQTLRRLRWCGTLPKAVLWWQGESNIGEATPGDTYARYLDKLFFVFRIETGINHVIAAKPTQMQTYPPIRAWALNSGFDTALNEDCTIQAVVDLSDIAPDDAVKQHITSNAKLTLAASRWFDVLKATFYSPS